MYQKRNADMTGGPEKNLVGGDKEASLLRPELSLNFAVQRSFKLAPLSPLAGSSTKLVIAAYRKTPTFAGFLLPPFFFPLPSFVMRFFLFRGSSPPPPSTLLSLFPSPRAIPSVAVSRWYDVPLVLGC